MAEDGALPRAAVAARQVGGPFVVVDAMLPIRALEDLLPP
ncbi:hypothetical protein BH23ACT2_BH23ACT2_18690 [soil metagenome]